MSKVTPTAAETIATLKASVNDLKAKLDEKDSTHFEYQERLMHLAERANNLRQRLFDADAAYTDEQLRVIDLEAELRNAHGWAERTAAQHFTDLKAIRDAAENQKVWNILFGLIAGFTAGWLIF